LFEGDLEEIGDIFWRSRRVEKRWGRGWPANRVGWAGGSFAWEVLAAIVVDSPWDSIAFSVQCCYAKRRSIYLQSGIV
jgi:hypothetical protein